MKTIDDFNFADKKVLLRVDFNVPLNKDYSIADDTRIQAVIPTIQKIRKDGGSVILMSHLGRPKTGHEEKYSLKHVVAHLSDLLNCKVNFADDCIGNDAKEMSEALQAKELMLLENLRFYPEEEKGDLEFAKKLASLGNFYVNDAFGTAHRAHASTTVIAQFFSDHKCFGYVMAREIANADKVMNSFERPFTAIMGGAKVSDKLLIIESLMDKVDNLIIGGGMAYTFFKAMGGKVGKSLVEEDRVELCKEIMLRAKTKNIHFLLPYDSITANAFSNDAVISEADNMNIPDDVMGLDIGAMARKTFYDVIVKSKTVLWNGPMGVFEMSNFANGTKAVAVAVVEATDKGAFTLIGGGDSAAAIAKFGFENKVSYVSTGGGALLEYFEGKGLPGIDAMNS
ncbi:MAG: phosphoglycerate kinase [Bacteroidetes bacterium]|nr:phosphoglycerate kinase [Bacteroidota bacterium]